MNWFEWNDVNKTHKLVRLLVDVELFDLADATYTHTNSTKKNNHNEIGLYRVVLASLT